MEDHNPPSLTYDVVVATRNRPDVLYLSLPLFLSQSRPPQRVIIVDSSDDPEPVRKAIDSLSEPHREKIDHHHTKPGLPAQRDFGLDQTASDIVMFPDDDALWFPDAAAEVMKVYERDAAGIIGGVGMLESRTPPAEVRDAVQTDRRPFKDRLLYRLGPVRAKVQGWFYPPPFRVLGEALTQTRLPQGWNPPPDCSLVPFIHGFRMTFRGEAIRKVGFDETLSGYALYEDMNVCYDVLKSHVLVESSRAHTYHHRAAGSRANPRATGAMLVLNMAYVVCRHTIPGDPARVALPAYMRVRARQYRLRAGDEFGRKRLEAVNGAIRWLDQFLTVEPDEVTALYHQAIADATAEPVKAS